MMDENGELHAEAAQAISNAAGATDEAVDLKAPLSESSTTETIPVDPASNPFMNGEIKTLDGEIAGDEFAADAVNYQVLLGKIDSLLERLKLDA
jgi:ankyrin repeat and BTB/POZ domain-containing protein 1